MPNLPIALGRALFILATAGCVLWCRVGAAQARVGPFDENAPDSHLELLQAAIDSLGDGGGTVEVLPGRYVLDRPSGIRISAPITLRMDRVVLEMPPSMEADGQAIHIAGAAHVRLEGGHIVGHRDAWDAGTNIAGIRATGAVADLRVEGTHFSNLSANAIAVFGEEDAPIRDVTVRDVIAENCCNYYGDYLSDQPGPAPGSNRRDQGLIAFYHVIDWLVDGCRLSGSQSDGTHFYHSDHGRFVNSIVEDSQMGGYFVEGCRNVIASNNLIRRNGSRGVTIERDSVDNILANNIVEESGREGLWAPDVARVLVVANTFRTNGRKDDAEKDCEIRLDDMEKFETTTASVMIRGNMFVTTSEQTAAIYVAPEVEGIEVDNSNTFIGPAREVVYAEAGER